MRLSWPQQQSWISTRLSAHIFDIRAHTFAWPTYNISIYSCYTNTLNIPKRSLLLIFSEGGHTFPHFENHCCKSKDGSISWRVCSRLEGKEKCILKFAPQTHFNASSKCDVSSIPATNCGTPGEDARECKVKYPVDVIWSEVSAAQKQVKSKRKRWWRKRKESESGRTELASGRKRANKAGQVNKVRLLSDSFLNLFMSSSGSATHSLEVRLFCCTRMEIFWTAQHGHSFVRRSKRSDNPERKKNRAADLPACVLQHNHGWNCDHSDKAAPW